ncbi:MAG: hypothetical protein WCI47_02215 [bacterium]
MNSVPSSASTPVDLRRRRPTALQCAAHPCDCSNCAWGFVTPEAPGYTAGQPIPVSFRELSGAYTGLCGDVQPVVTVTGQLGAIRDGRFYPAVDNEALRRYLPVMGVSPVG